MAFNLGDVFLTIKTKTEGLQQGLAHVQGFTEGVHKFANRSVKAFDATVAAASKFVKILAVATVAAGFFALKSAADFEQSRIAFDTMLGSAREGAKMMKKLSDFARKTPFELPEVVEGAKRLLAYGFEANKIIPTMRNLGNIVAGVGKDKLPQLILAFGQVKAATFLTGMELRQFTEAGVPLLNELAKQSGKSAAQIKEDMENGIRIPFSEVEKALQAMSGEGGRFFNLMERQSRSLSGVVSNMKDQIGRFARGVVGISETGDIKEGSLFARLAAGAQRLLAWMDEHSAEIEAYVQNIVTKTADGAERIVRALAVLISWFQKLPGPIKSGLGAIAGFAATAFVMLGIIKSLLAPFKILLGVIGGLILLVNYGTVALFALSAALVVPVGAILLVVGAIVALIAIGVLLWKNWDTIKAKASQLWQWLQRTWDSILSAVRNFVGGVIHWFQQLPGRIMGIVSAMVNGVINFIAKLPERIAFVLGFLAGLWIRGWILLFDIIKSVVPAIIRFIVDFFSRLPGRVWGFIIATKNRIVEGFKAAWNWIRSTLPGVISGIIGWFSRLPGRIWSVLMTMKNRGISAIKSFVSSAVQWFRDLPGKLINAIGDLGGMLYDKLKSIASSAWKGFKKGLGIESPSFIEKALFAIHDASVMTVDRIKTDVKKLNGMAGAIGRPMSMAAMNLSGNAGRGLITPPAALTAGVSGSPVDVKTIIQGNVNVGSDMELEHVVNRLNRMQELDSMGVST